MHETDRGAVGAEGLYGDMLASLAEVEKTLGDYSDVIDHGDAVELRETVGSLRGGGRELLDDGRLMRLGVIGQVKAGKSSLLNVMLFDGKEVLPRAATPMTASLTHILRSDRDEIEVEYYSESDWEEVRRHAEQYRKEAEEREQYRREAQERTAQESKSGRDSKPPPEPPEFLRASHELVEMARGRGIRIRDYLGRKDRHDVSVDGLNKLLRGLVGAEGELTPLVKSVTIRCSQGMPEIDIVDTPGINDPIVSRSRETRKLLGRCDAVLLLSYSGQFMDSEDATFFQRRVPAEGIARRVLLGSKFDSALVDVARDHGGDLYDAVVDTRARLVEHAMGALRRTSRDRDTGVSEEDVLFVSPMCAALARRPSTEWSDDEREVFENLRRGYPDWLDPVDGEVGDATRAMLSEIGNRDGIDGCLAAVRRDKESIMERKVGDFLSEKQREVEERLLELADDLRVSRDDLESGALSANESTESLYEVLEDIREEVTDKWEDLVHGERQRLDMAVRDIGSEVKEAREGIRDAVRMETRTKWVDKPGAGAWFARKLWGGGQRQKSYSVQVEDKTQIREAVSDFAEALSERVELAVNAMFQAEFRDRAKRDMSTIVAGCVSNELASALDTNALRRSIRRAVDRIRCSTRKKLDQALEEFEKELGGAEREESESANTSMTGLPGMLLSALSNLREMGKSYPEKAHAAVDEVARIVKEWAADVESKVEEVTERASTVLVPAVAENLESERKRLEEDLANREFRLQRYGLAIEAVERCVGRFAST